MSKKIICNPYDFIKMSNKNHNNTRKLLNVQKGYVLHHKDENMMYDDPERYAQWNPEGWVRKKLPHKVPAWNKGLKKEVM